jgi:hypothetical protein
LFLIYINIKGYLWATHGMAVWISALQFVAKGHEMLMQASIGLVVLAYIQYLLVHEVGVPFGALFAYYSNRVLPYLVSKEFRASVTTPTFRGPLKIGFVCFVVFSVLLASSVGPSSAITMLPRLVNVTATAVPVSFRIPGSSSSWAMPNINSVDIQTSWSSIWLVQSNTRRLSLQYAPNSTFATIQRYLASVVLAHGSEQIAQMLPDTGSYSIANMNSQQPVTSVFCQLNSITGENDTRPIQFPDRYVVGCGELGADPYCNRPVGTVGPPINLFYGLSNFTNISRADIWNQLRESQQGRVIWVDDIPVSSPFNGTALGAIVVQPELCVDSLNQTFLSTAACVIGATWANMTAFMQTQYRPDYSYLDGPIQAQVSPTTFLSLNWSSPGVKLSQAWAEGLNPMTTIQDRTVVDNLLRWTPLVTNVCPPNGTYVNTTVYGYDEVSVGSLTSSIRQRPYMQEALLASLIANGMAFPDVDPDPYFYESDEMFPWFDPHDESNGAYAFGTPPGPVLTTQGVIPGYAHGHSGVPVKIALGVLIVYVLLALGFVFYTIITGQSELTWGSIAELTALALNSSPTRAMKNTSAGISQVETFRRTVSVREVEQHHRLELVFDQDSNSSLHRRVNAGRAY